MKNSLFVLIAFTSISAAAQTVSWPVLKHYEGKWLDKVAMPVGGIGTGNISIGGNGQWKDVELMNKPGIGFYGSASPKLAPCFMVFTKEGSGKKNARALMGPVPVGQFQGMQGSEAPNNGFPRFRHVVFDVAYPFAVVSLDDESMPVSARLRTFNPFIPCDADASGLPVAVIRYEISNKTAKELTVSVAGSMDNFIGMDGSVVEFNSFDRSINPLGAKHNRNIFKKTPGLAGLFMSSDSVDKDASAWGTMALTITDMDKRDQVSYRKELNPKGWNADVNDLWDDFSDDGIFMDTLFEEKKDIPHGALAVQFRLKPHEKREIQFLLTWDFPNRKDWNDKQTVGNYYSTQYEDAWDVAEKFLPKLHELEARTLDFVNLFVQSDFPAPIKEAALFNSSTLRSQTVFRTADGNFFGWEGVFNSTGSCYGNCTHVWNYEQATAFLFGSLALKMRNIEFRYGLNDSSGLMSFRVSLPLDKNSNWKVAAADGQMGTIMKMYRDWQLSGSDRFLQSTWPEIKKTLSFAWVPGGWDADRDGVMEGVQHNTMDIEYYGPNPEIEFWYLGALKAGEAMAAAVADTAFRDECERLYRSGRKWVDANMFNSEFYIQKIRPVSNKNEIAFGLVAGMGARDLQNPDFQIGEGCLVDQLVGQYMAHICELGWLADSSHIKKAMQSIWKYNYVSSFEDQFNNMRTYGLGNESGLVLTAYPDPSKRPRIPLSYCNETWSGLEYTAATEMLYCGMIPEAIKTVKNVRNRYDGWKRNPFNEEECGNHYARAMASWATTLAWNQFNYSAVTGKFSVNSKNGRYFWSNGYAWGNFLVKDGRISIEVHFGNVRIKSIELRGMGQLNLDQDRILKAGEKADFQIRKTVKR